MEKENKKHQDFYAPRSKYVATLGVKLRCAWLFLLLPKLTDSKKKKKKKKREYFEY